MRRIVALFAVFALFGLPNVGHAADLYADSLVTSGPNTLTASNALGAPDGAYADFLDDDAYVKLDMGDEVAGDLTIHMYLLSVGANYRATFFDADGIVLDTASAFFTSGQTAVTATYEGAAPYRYVLIDTTETEEWRLDAVEATALADEEVVDEDPVDEEPVEETPSYTVGSLLKNGSSSAVYILGSDGLRHAFPAEAVFASWGLSFDDVMTVEDATLASYSLGKNVTYRAGVYLLKLQTNPKVYAVEPGGVLRWVTSEALALQLYGADWANRVIDVSDAFWGNYTVGEDIESAVHPDGSLITDSRGTWYVADAAKAELTAEVLAEYRYDEDIATPVNTTISSQYAEMPASMLLEGSQWPY